MQQLTSAGWVDVSATVHDYGTGVYSAVTPRCTTATYFRLHFSGDGPLTQSTDLGAARVLPNASLTRPSGSSRAKYKKYYTMKGTLRPGHAGRPVKILGIDWLARGGSRSGASTPATRITGSYSSYSLKVKLAKGKWRFYAVHSDTSHAYTKSGYLSVTCK